jgi:PIN domain nuclease of toxin-antitoxin system
MLVQKGRVQVDTGCQSFITLILQANNCHVRPITPQIAARCAQLPDTINLDPADRLIVATTMVEKMSLVTADENLRAASLVPTIW